MNSVLNLGFEYWNLLVIYPVSYRDLKIGIKILCFQSKQ